MRVRGLGKSQNNIILLCRDSLKMRIDELFNMYEEDGEFNEGLDRVWIMSEMKYLKDQVMMMNLFIKKGGNA